MKTSAFAIIAGMLSFFSNLHAEYIAHEIEDPACDAAARAAFSSDGFNNTVLHYCLDEKNYYVRLIHNPEGTAYKASNQYRFNYGEDLSTISVTWNYKYGILVDQEAPQELIDHLSQFTNVSWWNWYFSFKISNGTYVTYTEEEYRPGYTLQTTYKLDTWFKYMKDPYVK